jgi:hypothetical protein
MISRIVYGLFVICLILGLVLVAIAAFLVVAGLFGILFGGSTSLALFGATISLGVLGATAVKLGIVIFFVGFFLLFLAWILWLVWAKLIPWLRTIAPPAAGTILGFTGTGTSNLLTFPWLGLGSGVGFFEILLMPADQLAKLPPNMLVMVECLRKCFCEMLCQGATHSHGGPGDVVIPDPGRVADDVMDRTRRAKQELEAQLATARQDLEDAVRRGDVAAVNRLKQQIEDLTTRIIALG